MVTYALKLSTHNKPHLNQSNFGHWNSDWTTAEVLQVLSLQKINMFGSSIDILYNLSSGSVFSFLKNTSINEFLLEITAHSVMQVFLLKFCASICDFF